MAACHDLGIPRVGDEPAAAPAGCCPDRRRGWAGWHCDRWLRRSGPGGLLRCCLVGAVAVGGVVLVVLGWGLQFGGLALFGVFRGGGMFAKGRVRGAPRGVGADGECSGGSAASCGVGASVPVPRPDRGGGEGILSLRVLSREVRRNTGGLEAAPIGDHPPVVGSGPPDVGAAAPGVQGAVPAAGRGRPGFWSAGRWQRPCCRRSPQAQPPPSPPWTAPPPTAMAPTKSPTTGR